MQPRCWKHGNDFGNGHDGGNAASWNAGRQFLWARPSQLRGLAIGISVRYVYLCLGFPMVQKDGVWSGNLSTFSQARQTTPRGPRHTQRKINNGSHWTNLWRRHGTGKGMKNKRRHGGITAVVSVVIVGDVRLLTFGRRPRFPYSGYWTFICWSHQRNVVDGWNMSRFTHFNNHTV